MLKQTKRMFLCLKKKVNLWEMEPIWCLKINYDMKSYQIVNNYFYGYLITYKRAILMYT